LAINSAPLRHIAEPEPHGGIPQGIKNPDDEHHRRPVARHATRAGK
jgi:hypothetical protein